MRFSLCNGWYYANKFSDALLNPNKELLSTLEKIDLPHSVIVTDVNYFSENDYQLISGYFKTFKIDAKDQNKSFILTFLGAAHQATVYINGHEVITHSCGYTGFKVDISEYIYFDKENILTVKLNSKEDLNIPPFGNVIDYLTYGGLYREVYLDIVNQVHFDEVFLSGDQNKILHLTSSLSKENNNYSLLVEILDKDKQSIFNEERPYQDNLDFNIKKALLWDNQHPNIYKVILTLKERDIIIDTYEGKVGFRSIEGKNDGIYLNGKKIKIRGLNRHQSYPYVGYSMPKRGQENDALILKKELKINAVRTSHYPQDQHFIDKCDEIGLMVFMEFPGWQHIGDEKWINQALINEEEMIKQYYNHPSIFMWGVRINESPDDDSFYKRSNALAHKLDKTRLTGGVRNSKKSHLFEDIYTYNDFVHNGHNEGVEKKKKVTSDMKKPYIVTEYNGHMFPTKSFDDEHHREEQALRHAKVLNDVMKYDDIGGSFGWCFADYNTHKDFGAGDRICYHGVMDIFRNPKLAAAVYQSQGEEPTLIISSSMNIGEYPAGNISSIYAFTNCDYIKLYKNDKFVKSFYPDKKSSLKHPPIKIDDLIGDLLISEEKMNRRTSDNVKECLLAISRYGQAGLPLKYKLKIGLLLLSGKFTLESGTALYGKYIQSWGEKVTIWKFEGYKNDKKVIEVIKAPTNKVNYQFIYDTLTLDEEDTYDVATIRVRAVDENNNPLPYINRALTVKAEGDIRLLSPKNFALLGGSNVIYVASNHRSGQGKISIYDNDNLLKELNFEIKCNSSRTL